MSMSVCKLTHPPGQARSAVYQADSLRAGGEHIAERSVHSAEFNRVPLASSPPSA